MARPRVLPFPGRPSLGLLGLPVLLLIAGTPARALAQRGTIIGHVIRLVVTDEERDDFTHPVVGGAPTDTDVQYVIVHVPALRTEERPVPGGGIPAAVDYLLHLRSRGGLGGGAMELQLFGSMARGRGLSGPVVVEPVRLGPRAVAEMRDDLARSFPGGPEILALDAYCLERLKSAPAAGVVFRVAPPEVQRRHAEALRALDAARRVREEGRLRPDSDPTEYYHSIAQWAIWAMEEGLDESRFTEAFVQHTRRSVEDSGVEWTDEIEHQVRGFVPGRWRDVRRVVADAGGDGGDR